MTGVAIFTGIWYFIVKADWGYGLNHAIRQPIFSAMLIGIVMGDLKQAMIIGAAVEVLYIGLVPAGSNMPADDALAGLIAVPIALQANLEPSIAIAIAVPVGIVGVFIDQLRKTLNATFIHMADKYAEEGDTRKITLAATLYPLLLSFVLRFPIPFLANLYGADAVTKVMNAIPEWLTHGFTVAGGMLPALGFAITIFVIGKKELLPWFFIGYFLVQYAGLPVMGAAVFGICAVLLITINKRKSQEA
ncbi:PTS mannose/fructose/sorbose/N-acetylgalactosamine transporter subunit IIC [Candidatus Enterococcus ferrettii]|uniref:PTS system, D-glucosaminate-specific IIC component n=1 Tax=Candidatus Enterococcus ferrettii TaxID=2815324 RepID=A0ABV0EPD4_9ENTE|nr:PTS sugar transporter subunit IIC [Enterococcus sp. 665A]MBO1340715.1 PTS sugar transporter subunit IIC [Enterococcus sp. 665A]